MRKQTLLTAAMLTMVLPAVMPYSFVSAQQPVVLESDQKQSWSIDQVTAEISKKAPVSSYFEATISGKMVTGDGTEAYVMYRKVWDHTAEGELREEVVPEDGKTTYYASSMGKAVSYRTGDQEANLYPAGVTAETDNEINKTIRSLEELRRNLGKTDSHVSYNISEESLLERTSFHITKKETLELEGGAHLYVREIWIDKETGFTLKDVHSDNNHTQISEYTVTKVDFAPDYNEHTFKLDLPEDVTLVDITEVIGDLNNGA